MAIDVGSAIAYLDLDVSKFDKGIASAKARLQTFTDETATASQKFSALGSTLSAAGSTLTKTVTLPIVGLGTAAVKTTAQFDSAMSKVSAIMGDKLNGQFDELRDKAIQMGNETKFSATESAEAFTYMAMAGWDAQQAMDGIDGIMSLAAADGLDLATTSDIVTDALTAFGLKASDSAHFADVLAQASSSANTNVSMLGESFKYVAPVAGAMGMNVEDVAVALGLMANSGIKASQAGTTLRTSLTRMTKPTKQVQAVLDQLDFSMTNSDGTMKSLMQVMEELRDRFSGLTEAEKTQAATTLFGQHSMAGMLAVINASEEDFESLANSIANADGRAKDMSEVMIDNLSGALTLLKSNIETLMIKVGDALVPTITKIAEGISKLVTKLNEMDDAQVEQIVRIAAIVAAIGPALLVLGKLFQLIGSIGSAIQVISSAGPVLSGIGSFLGPILAVVAAVAALVAIFREVYSTNEELRESVASVWETISGFIDTAKEKIATFVESLHIIPDMLKETFNANSDEIGGGFISIFDNLKNALENLKPIIDLIANLFGGVLLTAISVVSGAINGLLEALGPALDIIGQVIRIVGDLGGALVSLFTGDFEGVGDYFVDIWEGIKQIFIDAFDAIVGLFAGFGEGFWETLKSLFSDNAGIDLGEVFTQMWESVSGFFINAKNSIVQFFSDLGQSFVSFVTETIPSFIDSVIEWFQNLPYNIGYALGQIGYHLADLGQRLIEWATTAIPQFIQNVGTFLKELPQKFVTKFLEVIQKIAEFNASMNEKIRDAMQKFGENIIKKLKELPQKFTDFKNDIIQKLKSIDLKQIGKDIMNSLWNGLKDIWGTITGWFDEIGTKIKNFFQGIKDGFSDAKESAQGLSSSVDGSHANGLSYVPFDGYVAQLHQGERVLTKEENKSYGDMTTSGNTFNFYGTERLSQRETVQAFRQTMKQFSMGVV